MRFLTNHGEEEAVQLLRRVRESTTKTHTVSHSYAVPWQSLPPPPV